MTIKKVKLKAKKDAWFVPVRWSYLPASWQGWLLYIPYLLYLIITFALVFYKNDSFGSSLLGIIPYWVAGAVVMHWIATHKS